MYGIFKSKEEHDAWMAEHAEVQNKLADLRFKLSVKEAEIAAGEANGLISDLSKDDMLDMAHSVLSHAVTLLGLILGRVAR
jgi:hypothetical protein